MQIIGLVFMMQYLFSSKGGNNFVYIANPNVLENILRAEGKYPRRESNLSSHLQWILSKQNFAVPLPFKYDITHYHARL